MSNPNKTDSAGSLRYRDSALVAYHANCVDGFTSAWVTCKALSKEGMRVHLLPMNYEEESELELFATLQDDFYKDLYVVDFSLRLEVLEVLSADYYGTRTVILDHHKTAFELYAPELVHQQESCITTTIHNAVIIIDNTECGASLCWKHFNQGQPLPRLIEYVKDYDLWKFDLGKNTRYINNAIRIVSFNLDRWDDLEVALATPEQERLAINAGRTIQQEHDKKVAKIVELAKFVEIAGYKVMAVRCPREFTNDVGHALAVVSKTFGAVYDIDINSDRIKWSLRSYKDFDVSKVAKLFGGGGHKGAAGFSTPLIPRHVDKLEATENTKTGEE